MRVILYCITMILFVSCSGKSLKKDPATFSQVWDSSYHQYRLYPSDNPDIEEHMGWEERFRHDLYSVPVLTPQAFEVLPLKTSGYKRLEEHIYSITNEGSEVIRIVNTTHGPFVSVHYIQGNDTISSTSLKIGVIKDTISLYNYCWIIRNDKDSLRYIYYDDIRKKDSARIIDTTVYSHDAIMEQTDFLCTLDSNAIRRSYPLIRYRTPYHIYFEAAATGRYGGLSTEISYWKEGRFVYVHLPQLWNYSFCGEEVKAEGKDGEIVQSVMEHLCFVREHGGFQDGFIVVSP
jgi:hypothetical protein